MFAKATKNFVRETDCGGDLIPVSRLNDSDKLQLLSLVTKRKKFWCWQKPNYHLLTVTLSDLLEEDKPIKPVIVESDFVKYEGKFEDCVRGNLEASFGNIRLGAGGKGLVESQSSFGNLRKQEVDLQQLMNDVKERKVKFAGSSLSFIEANNNQTVAPTDISPEMMNQEFNGTMNLNNTLLQQVLERKHEVLCVLTEKIVTTKKCLISEHIQTEEKIGGIAGFSTKVVKVSVSENGNMMKDSNVVLEIPAPTTIAYGVIELYIKHDGQFEFCLLNGQQGGFEREDTAGSSYPHSVLFRDTSFLYQPDAVDSVRHSGDENTIPSDASLSVLKQGILVLKTQFQPFVKLSDDKQGALYKTLYEILYHDELVTVLEDMVNNICMGDKPKLMELKEVKPEQQQDVADFLQLVGYSLQNGLLLQEEQRLFSAAHLLISAVAELPDETLALLGACCDLQVVPALCCLPNVVSADGTLPLSDPTMATFSDTGRFHIVQRLFASSNINLKMTESTVKAVTTKEPRFFPFILYIALYGFYALGGNL
ncbi:PREDICTED: non-syndromic hearing impairment protein 5 isoform X1 [Gavialis gangeticus]|uniref:non-syndromic hearing impairment protein 5 isoform X1 n=1 Tax=Gavialis gangeticus TaxID=94835 RepID=UPI00092FB2DD|nr:PREDICTED: non-syndromic hearing impairment protein 5 isoform X1 [Gavialis gangeticus]XP_019364141.1 PREDICTED: non-syndromic hearing impairment protein 5 isoform X1 [Gavialis gangeticus]XP_019364142.1 PREDICTED: non-syndromic hearing impairment protein 5 isoform X1 [Gavialis gangeticus]XP_019364143.1 PREDICTED: non-syndromic hearing impairment protein 5 isoform X1 [Gavialis gangeticus]XP_019364144.1 PREDICTED: non-syndromic hearing impairment protein 5 isoform X1 [Gavialis gangeticus]